MTISQKTDQILTIISERPLTQTCAYYLTTQTRRHRCHVTTAQADTGGNVTSTWTWLYSNRSCQQQTHRTTRQDLDTFAMRLTGTWRISSLTASFLQLRNLTLRHTLCNTPSFSCSSLRISSYYSPICDLQDLHMHIKPNTKHKTQSTVRSFTLANTSTPISMT